MTPKVFSNIIATILWGLFPIISFGQVVTGHLSTDTIKIGEQAIIQLSLKLDNRKDNKIVWPSFENLFSKQPILVVANRVDTVSITEGDQLIRNQIIITSFDSGRYKIPTFELLVNNQKVKTDTLVLNVIPPDVSQLKDFHPLKPIEDVASSSNMLVIGLLAVIALISILFIYTRYYLSKKTKYQQQEITFPSVKTLADCERILNELAEHLPNKDLTFIVIASTDLLHQMIAQQQSFSIHHFTTFEKLTLCSTNGNTFWSNHADALQQVWQLTDQVKFSRYLPTTQQASAHLNSIQQLINHLFINQS